MLYDFILDPHWVITVSSSGHLASYTFDPYDVSINLLFPGGNNCPAASNDISRKTSVKNIKISDPLYFTIELQLVCFTKITISIKQGRQIHLKFRYFKAVLPVRNYGKWNSTNRLLSYKQIKLMVLFTGYGAAMLIWNLQKIT